MPRHTALLPVVLALSLYAHPGHGADSANGQKIAETWCVSCHTVSGRTAGRDSAPPFEFIARNRAIDRDRLIQILSDPHPPMPKVHLSRKHLDDVIAYIQSLRPAR